MKDLLIVIPAYNESESIKGVVDSLKKNYSEYDYIVVNDGSKDNTADICLESGYALLNMPNNLGLSGAVQAGMRYAYRYGYNAVLQFDGDGQHRPEYIKKMLSVIKNDEADIVIGSRFVEEKKPHTMRMMGNNLISALIHLTTGKKINDPTSGMRIYGRRVITEFARNINYGPEPDTISYLIRNGIRVKEIQVTMDERTAGQSYLNFSRSIKYMVLQCFSILFIQAFRRRID